MPLSLKNLSDIAALPTHQITLKTLVENLGISPQMLAGGAADGQLQAVMSPELSEVLNSPLVQGLILIAVLERVGAQFNQLCELMKQQTEATQALRAEIQKGLRVVVDTASVH